MTINKDDYYLKNIGLLKQLEPIMKKKGIDSDNSFCIPETRWECIENRVRISTWIKPSLEAALSRHWKWIYELSWCISENIAKDIKRYFDLEPFSEYTLNMVVYLYKTAVRATGQASLEALAQLIILLDEEGVE